VGSATIATAEAAVFTFQSSLLAANASASLAPIVQAFDLSVGDFDSAVALHGSSSLQALDAVRVAQEQLAIAGESFMMVDAYFDSLESSFDQMLAAFGEDGLSSESDLEAAASFAAEVGQFTAAGEHEVNTATIAFHNAGSQFGIGQDRANEAEVHEETARQAALVIAGSGESQGEGEGGGFSGGLIGAMALGTSAVEGHADVASDLAALAQSEAATAGSSVALALSNRASVLAAGAIARALDATSRFAAAQASNAQIQQTLSQNDWTAASSAVGGLSSEMAAAQSQLVEFQGEVTDAGRFTQLANATVGAAFGLRDATIAAATALDSQVAAEVARADATEAVNLHNTALAAVEGLVTASIDTVRTAQSESGIAILQAGVANARFVDTQSAVAAGDSVGASTNAGLSQQAADRSTTAANLSDAAAAATRGFADEAALHVQESAPAEGQYLEAVAQAHAAVASAVGAVGGANSAVNATDAFASAAAALAQQLNTRPPDQVALLAGSAAAIALQARDDARIQRDQAVLSRQAAEEAAADAQTRGQQVFFQAVANRAAIVEQRANQARAAADAALSAAQQAQSDAAAAAALAGQSGGGPPT
jgi:hypothetical protein